MFSCLSAILTFFLHSSTGTVIPSRNFVLVVDCRIVPVAQPRSRFVEKKRMSFQCAISELWCDFCSVFPKFSRLFLQSLPLDWASALSTQRIYWFLHYHLSSAARLLTVAIWSNLTVKLFLWMSGGGIDQPGGWAAHAILRSPVEDPVWGHECWIEGNTTSCCKCDICLSTMCPWCQFVVQAEPDNDEVYAQLTLLPESKVSDVFSFHTLLHLNLDLEASKLPPFVHLARM